LPSDALRDAWEELPEPIFAVLHRDTVERFEAPELYARVQRREGIPTGRALESAQVVLEVLAESLSDESLARIKRELPPSVAELLQVRDREGRMPAPVVHRIDRSISGGRPGPRHPVSEARGDRVQSGSVALERDPHEGTKLSSGRTR
jgi:hypothetical protein